MLGTVPAATMFKRDIVTASSTSPDVSSDLALTCVGWCPKGKPTKSEYENYPSMKIIAKHHLINNYIDGEGNPGNSQFWLYLYI